MSMRGYACLLYDKVCVLYVIVYVCLLYGRVCVSIGSFLYVRVVITRKMFNRARVCQWVLLICVYCRYCLRAS